MSDPMDLQALVYKGSAEGREVALVRLMSLLGKDSCSLGNVLVHAATAGDAEVLSMLLAAAAKPEELVLTSREASTARIPLMAAAGGGHLAAVKELLAHAPQQQLEYSTMQAQGTGGHEAVTALHEAAAHGNTEVLSVLLATSSQPEQLVMARNQAEHTPLMMAASAGNTSCCQALMQYNLDQQLAATSRDHCLALHLSVMHGHDETAALLLSHNPRPQLLKLSTEQKAPLHYAVSSGSVACVRLLLEHHPQEQVELNNVEGQAPLRLAAALGNADIVQLLLAHTDQPAQLTAALSAIRDPSEPTRRMYFGSHSNMFPFKLSEGQQRCCRLLFAKGGDPTDLLTEQRRAVISALRESVQQAMQPEAINEALKDAVVQLAHRAAGRPAKRSKQDTVTA